MFELSLLVVFDKFVWLVFIKPLQVPSCLPRINLFGWCSSNLQVPSWLAYSLLLCYWVLIANSC